MWTESVETIMTVRFDSFREMFQFLNGDRGQVLLEHENGEDGIVAVTRPSSDGIRNYFIYRPHGDEESEVQTIAKGILPDQSNVDEESLAEEFDLGKFRGVVTIGGKI